MKMTTSNSEICENCGFEKYRHNEKEGIVYTGLEPRIYDCSKVCKKFTPKIEKTEVQTICPLGETIPDFTQEIEKFKENNQTLLNEASENLGEDNNHTAEIRVRVPSKPERKEHVLSNSGVSSNWQDTVQNKGFSTPNCEICKDYPKEYWCGNPKNKVSNSNEEIIEKVLKERETYDDGFMSNEHCKKMLRQALSEADKLHEKEIFEASAMLNRREDYINFLKDKNNKTLEEIKAGIEEFKKRIMINGNLSHRIIETPNGEFEYSHDYVLNNIVIELIDEIFDNALKEMEE